jgi:hypothetical protein
MEEYLRELLNANDPYVFDFLQPAEEREMKNTIIDHELYAVIVSVENSIIDFKPIDIFNLELFRNS